MTTMLDDFDLDIRVSDVAETEESKAIPISNQTCWTLIFPRGCATG